MVLGLGLSDHLGGQRINAVVLTVMVDVMVDCAARGLQLVEFSLYLI